ncbi:MAG: FecR domain-containing protein [Desulfobaccales bacterium]
MTPKKLWAIMALWFCLMIAAGAQAAVVGRFTAVEGPVDILKQGKVPATAAQVNDGVEPGDVIRTKANAKAQVKFLDDSQVTLAPESRMAVADYTYNGDKGERRAVLRFFKGVMHTVVTRLLKVQQPNFLMQTHTAILGVRGTETYTVLLPNATGAYLIEGLLELSSSNPQIQGGQLLQSMEFSTIPLGQPPTIPRPISPAMLEMLKNLMNTGLKETAFLGVGAAPRGPELLQIPEVLGFTRQERLNQPVIPPQVVPPVMTPPTAPTPTLTPSGGSATGS